MKRAALSLACLLCIHVLSLLITFLLRLALFLCMDYDFPAEAAGQPLLQMTAFLKGLWFDNVIACYILILPLAVLWVAALFHYTSRGLFRFIAVWECILHSLVFVISAANIPYFCYFFKNINSSIYNWFGYGATTAGMVFGETAYYLPIALGVLAILLFGYLTLRITRFTYSKSLQWPDSPSKGERGIILLAGALCCGLCIFGIRGRTGYNPIKVSQAYYCEDPFLNQLGISPTFNLMTSTLDDRRKENRYLTLMDEQEAIRQVRQLLGRKGTTLSPIAREVKTDTVLAGRPNVVIILMESMSAHLMQSFGARKQLTPFLDSLYHESLSFSNCYSAGIHTNHGMYATLYSFPAMMKRNLMKGSVIPQYSGLPTVLRQNGYHNLFFMTHESQYDNMNAFLRTNGFDEIFAQENYPSDKVVNSFGVQDDFLYSYAIPVLNRRAQSGKPFFTVLLSISNHPPYVIPDYFHPQASQPEEQIVEYADWAIARFFAQAKQQPWFKNTIFVLLGDHGKLVGTPECEMPQSYNHIPLMICGPGIQPEIRTDFCGQTDLAPTLLHLLGINYVQNNFGIDLQKEKRPCIFYTADDWIAARDSASLYLYSPDSRQEFRYDLSNGKPVRTEEQPRFQALKNYVFSMLQSAEYLVKQHKTLDHE